MIKKLTVSIRIKWPKHSSFRTSVVGFFNLFSAPLECMNYSVLSEPGRHTSFVRGGNSDRSLVSGCYRFQSSSHTKMLDQYISPRKCLTLLSGFLNGCIHSSRMALSTGRRVSMVILIAATENLKLLLRYAPHVYNRV